MLNKTTKKIKTLIDLFSNVIFDFCLVIYSGLKGLFLNKKIYDNRITYITASDSEYFDRSLNLIASINLYDKNQEIIFYDLGLNKTQKEYLKTINNVTVKLFKFNDYPPFVSKRRDDHNKLGEYSWKGIIIYEELKISENNLLWLDAACVISKNPKLIKTLIGANGFYATYSSNRIKDWTHKDTLKYLDFPKNLYEKRNFMSGIVGVSKNILTMKIIKEWSKYSQIEECIAPIGSNRFNHRQDQAVLTLLIYLNNFQNKLSKYYRIYNVKIGQTFNKIFLQPSTENTEEKEIYSKLKKNFPALITNSIKKCEIIILLNTDNINKNLKKAINTKKTVIIFSNSNKLNSIDDSIKENINLFYIISTDVQHVKNNKIINYAESLDSLDLVAIKKEVLKV